MFQDLIVASRRLAQLYQFKRIRPAHLLHAMTGNETARLVMTQAGYDVHILRSVLISAFKTHSNEAKPGRGRTEASELFEICIENCESVEGLAYEDAVRLLFQSIVTHGVQDQYLGHALRKANIKAELDTYSDTAPTRERTSLDDVRFENEDELIPSVDDLFEDERLPDLDDLIRQENDLSPDGGGVFSRSGDLGYSRSRENEPSMKASFQEGRIEAEKSEKKTAPLSRESEEARVAMLAAQRNLSVLAREGNLDVVVGRESEIDQVIEILMRRRKPNVILVAEPGVGKSALVEGLAMKLATGACPDAGLAKREIVEVSLTSMIGGARYRGDFEARMDLMIKHAEQERQILFIDEIHTLMGSGSVSARSMDGANILKPVLARDSMSLIGATTPEEADVLRADKALMRRFEIIYIDEPLRKQMEIILEGASEKFLSKHDVTLPENLHSRLLDFGERYVEHRRNPDRTFDMLDLAAVSARLRGDDCITEDDLRHAVRRLGGMMMERSEVSDARREDLHTYLQSMVSGQDQAVQHICTLVHAMKCGTGHISPVTLSGPDGLGKTYSARKIAEFHGKNLSVVKVQSDRIAIEDIELRVKRSLEADADAVIAVKIPSSVYTKDIRETISRLLSADSRSRSFPVRKPLVFLIENAPPDGRIGFGFAPGQTEDDDQENTVLFEPLSGSSLDAVIDRVACVVAMRRQDAGLKNVPESSLRGKIRSSAERGTPTYMTLLSIGLKIAL